MAIVKYGTIVLFAFLLACSPKEPAPMPTVVDYMPLRKGLYQIYAVDSTVIKENAETTFSYELRTEVVDSFPNTAGGYTYLIQRSKRIPPSTGWTGLATWSARVNTIESVVNEGNISFVKMAGPLGNSKAWDGNALNTLGGSEKCLDRNAYSCDIYAINDFAIPYSTSSGKTFDNTLNVIQNDNKDLIVFQDKRNEVYAWKTGLIERNILSLNYCTDQDCVGTQFVSSGLKYRQIITAYGGL